MTDPVIEAAKRAWSSEGWGAGEPNLSEGSLAIASSREALEPLRAMHFPMSFRADRFLVTYCATCWGPDGRTVWPCRNAELIYSSEELKR